MSQAHIGGRLREWLGIWLRGVAMGLAELVPGVSGGTIAFISGIYLRLVEALRGIDRHGVWLLLNGRWRLLFRRVDAGFLALLLLGMGASVVTFAGLVQWLLQHHEIQIWSFFFGLIAGSVVYVAGVVGRFTPARLLLAAAGAVTGLVITQLGGLPPSESPLVTLLSGMVAVCAWILPGVSGSFLLLILGQYQRVIAAVSDLDLAFLGTLLAGCFLGLLLFTRVLGWLLRHYYAATLAFLCGIMAGSLQRLWPWQQVLSYQLDADGNAMPIQVKPLLPWQFQELYGDDPLVLGAVLAALAGVGLVLLLDRFSARQRAD